MGFNRDEITAEGITQPEAIGRRILEGIQHLLERHKAEEIDFMAAHTAIVALIDATLPFVDHGSKDVLYQVMRAWNQALEERREAESELAQAGTPGFGDWTTGAP